MKSRRLSTARLSFPLASAIAALLAASSSQAAPIYWDGVSASWNLNTNWATASGADTPDPGAVPGAADDAIFNISTVNGAETITLDANQAVNSMTFNNTGTTAITGGGTARTLSLGTGGITMASGAGAVTLGSGVAGNNVLLNLAGAQTWTNNSASAFTINNTAATFTRQTGATLTFNKASTGNFAVTSGVTNTSGIIGPWAFFGTGSSQRYATITAGNVAGLTGTTAANVNSLGSASGNYELTTGGTAGTTGRTANTIRYAGAATSISLYNGSLTQSYDLTVNGILAVGTGTFSITRSAAGTADAGLIIGATGELVIAGSQAVTISAPIQEGGAGRRLTYSGSNTLTLSGVNTYTGATTVSSGILRLNNALALQNSPLNTSGSIVGDSSNGLRTTVTTLTLGGLTGDKNFAATGGVFSTTSGGYGSVTGLTLNPGSGSNSYSGVIANGAAGMTLTKSGAGTQILSGSNLYTGATTISAGTLQLGAAGTTGTLDTGSAIVNDGILAINRTDAVVQGTDFSGAAITGTGGFTQAGSGTTTLTAANTFTGTTTVSAGKIIMTNPLALQNSAYNTTGSNGTTIGLDVTSGLSSGTLTLGGLSGAVDLASAITAGYTGSVTNLTLNPGSSASTYSGVIANGAANMNLIKTGAGGQILAGVNTYTGTTTISEGMLTLDNATALGTTPGVDGTSSISMAAGTTLRSNYIIADAGNVDSFVYAPITLSGTGSATFQTGAGSGTAPAEAVRFNLNGAIGGTAGTNAVFSTTSSNLGNTDSTFVLGAASTYDGNTTITTGNSNDRLNVKAGVADALPTTTVLTIDGGTGGGTGRITQYDLNGNNQTLAGLSNGGVVPNLRNQRVTNSGTLATLTINNSDDYTFGGSTLSGPSTSRAQIMGTLALVKSGVGTLTLGGTLTGGATGGGNTYTGATTINGGVLESTILANGGSASGIGQSTNAAANLVFGAPTATLRYTGSSNVAINRGFTLSSGAGGGATIESSGAGTFSFDNTVAIEYGTIDQTRTLTLGGSNTGSNTFGKSLANNGTGATSLVKNDAGTWVLNQSNTYTGNTTISGGKLALAGSGSIASSPTIIVGANTTFDVSAVTGGYSLTTDQTLSGTGTVAGAMNVSGTLSPGNSPGTLETGSQTWLDGGDYNFQMLDASGAAGTGFDQITVTGTLDLSSLTAGGFNINLWSLSSILPDTNGDALSFNNALTQSWTILTTTTGITGFDAANFIINVGAFNGTNGFSNALGGGGFSLEAASNDLVLTFTAVPEPNVAALLGGLGALMLLRRRRN